MFRCLGVVWEGKVGGEESRGAGDWLGAIDDGLWAGCFEFEGAKG